MPLAIDQKIVSHILESEGHLFAAHECSRVFPQVVEEIIRRRGDKMRVALAARPELRSFSCQTEIDIRESYLAPLACFTPLANEAHLVLLIEAQARPLRNMIIGIHWEVGHKNESPELARRLFSFFNEQFRQGKTSEWWPWYTDLRTPWNNWESAQALRALYKDELTDPEHDMLSLCMLLTRFFSMSHMGAQT